MEQKQIKNVASGALLLVSANFIVKIIGFVYKIPIGNILGSSALGYFSTAFEVYTLLLTVFISGGSVAVSKMVSESTALGHWADVRRMFRLFLIQFTLVGGLGTAVMYFLAGEFARQLDNSQATLSIICLSPAIFFLAVSCVFRGFFQGLHDMRPSSLSEVVEAFFKLLIGVGVTLWLRDLGKGDEVISAGAISGTTLSVALSTTVIVIVYLCSKNRKIVKANSLSDGYRTPSGELIRTFWKLAIPIALSSIVVNLTSFLDLFLIFQRLTSWGMTEEEANSVYGAYKGYAQSLFNLVPSIISSIGVSILPALSGYYVSGMRRASKRLIERSIKVVNLLALPSAVGMFVLAEPLLRLLYRARLDEIGVAIPILKILALASYFTCLATLFTALLQSIGKTHLPMFALIAGGLVKLGVNYVLVGTPSIGINGAPVGTLCCYIVMTVIDAVFLLKNIGRFNGKRLRVVRWAIRPGIAAGIMGVATYAAQKVFMKLTRETIATAGALCAAVLVYAVFILLLRGVKKKDLQALPGGTKLAAVLGKMKLIKG